MAGASTSDEETQNSVQNAMAGSSVTAVFYSCDVRRRSVSTIIKTALRGNLWSPLRFSSEFGARMTRNRQIEQASYGNFE
jgi:hypothetical protein